ncbi:YggS family pyridoxal phosphate-dependent enzyme [Myroides sp. WP-1]|uniref:YggS family pyridoxal phosphate-dependent enzyme n=1 Tax=Myroides sp. WP-1 TaxID=2759944 RepID=UPI0015FC0BA4|nr:YggS family pyridoxal phosphate-dependent enzyme [Myroides sp. WP-1]MBB1140949.1 YggS family pyridoxal phosphate-dependent enzyme [Myroides sp. WP-1]
MSYIQDNIKHILTRIERACLANHRDPKEVRLLLATKTVPAQRIRMALETGQTLIGENKVQEIKEKYAAICDLTPTNHFIGHLQTNKIKDILKYNVSCIHSVDRIDLATKLHQRLALENKTMDVLIQVNTSNEESKFGVAPKDTIKLIEQVAMLNTLHIKGLMTIGLFSAEEDKIRACFNLLKTIQQQVLDLNIPHVEMKELSMGMSGDLEIAIAEGATIVRVGTAIFGERIYPDSYFWNENN